MCDSVETSGLFSGRTKRTTDNIYEELMEIYKMSTDIWIKFNGLKEQTKDGNYSYFETPGRNLMKQLLDLQWRGDDLMKKMRTAYTKEIAEHTKRIEDEQGREFESATSIRSKYKAMAKPAGQSNPQDDEDLIATVAMVRDLMSMK